MGLRPALDGRLVTREDGELPLLQLRELRGLNIRKAVLEERTLAFRRALGVNASRLWIDAELDPRQRLQKVFFPEGVSYDGRVL